MDIDVDIGNESVKLEAIQLLSDYALHFADLPKWLRDDKEVALVAVKLDGVVIECMNDDLKRDKEVVLAAVEQDVWSYSFCIEAMQRDGDVIAIALRKCEGCLLSIEDYICDNLIKLKIKYGVDKLVDALELEAADIEMENLNSSVNKEYSVAQTIKNRL